MITMREVREKNYEIFPKETALSILNIQKGTLKYIEHLAAITETNIATWDPFAVFAKEDGLFPRERNKLNQLFFSHRERVKDSVASEILPQPDDERIMSLCASVNKLFAKSIETTMKKHESQIQDLERHMNNKSMELQRAQENYSRALLAKSGMKQKQKEGLSVHESVKRVIRDGWWTLAPDSDQSEGMLVFLTPEVTLSQINEKAAVNFVVPMGRYLVKLTTRSQSLKVRVNAYDKNPLCPESGLYHPHVNSSGEVCAGDAGKELTLAETTFDVEKIMRLLKAILTTYNDDNPYQELSTFQELLDEGSVYAKASMEERRNKCFQFFRDHRVVPVSQMPEAPVPAAEPRRRGLFDTVVPTRESVELNFEQPEVGFRLSESEPDLDDLF